MRRCSKCRTAKSPDDFHKSQSYCKPCMKAYSKAWRQGRSRGDRRRESMQSRLRKYGLSLDQYEALLAKQFGLCAICHERFDATPCIDHNHTTGVVRGLLCRTCNRALGLFRDDRETLLEAADYIRRGR